VFTIYCSAQKIVYKSLINKDIIGRVHTASLPGSIRPPSQGAYGLPPREIKVIHRSKKKKHTASLPEVCCSVLCSAYGLPPRWYTERHTASLPITSRIKVYEFNI